MTATLIALMLLAWVSLGVYGKDAPRGCLLLAAAPFLFLLMVSLQLLVLASTLGRRTVRIKVEEVQ